MVHAYQKLRKKNNEFCVKFSYVNQWWWCDALLLLAQFNNFIGTYPNRYYKETPYSKD